MFQNKGSRSYLQRDKRKGSGRHLWKWSKTQNLHEGKISSKITAGSCYNALGLDQHDTASMILFFFWGGSSFFFRSVTQTTDRFLLFKGDSFQINSQNQNNSPLREDFLGFFSSLFLRQGSAVSKKSRT